MINAILVTPIHFTGFEKVETSHGPEYLFYGSNCINYYRDMHENVISSYYKNIPDIKTCHDRIGDRIWKREITVTEVKKCQRVQEAGQRYQKRLSFGFFNFIPRMLKYSRIRGLNYGFGDIKLLLF